MLRVHAIAPLVLVALTIATSGSGGQFGTTVRQMLRPVLCSATLAQSRPALTETRKVVSRQTVRLRACVVH